MKTNIAVFLSLLAPNVARGYAPLPPPYGDPRTTTTITTTTTTSSSTTSSSECSTTESTTSTTTSISSCPTASVVTTTVSEPCYCPWQPPITTTVTGSDCVSSHGTIASTSSSPGTSNSEPTSTSTGGSSTSSGGSSSSSFGSTSSSFDPSTASSETSSTSRSQSTSLSIDTSISTIQSSTRTTTSSGSTTTRVRPTCTLSDFPETFYIRDSASGYLAVDPNFNRVFGVRSKRLATPFHVVQTNDGPISGIQQLAYKTTRADDSEAEYRAFIRYTGGAVRFFDSSFVPQAGNNFAILTASFSSSLCQMSLITWQEHDLSYPANCAGTLHLDGGQPDNGCIRVRLTVSAA